MGVLKFRVTPPELAEEVPELRRAYFSGLDRTPERLDVEVRPGMMTCSRESPDSGRVHVPFPVAGAGLPFVGTATLADRAAPFELAVELARGKLNEIRGQSSDWRHLGLTVPDAVDRQIAEACRSFAKAATTSSDDPAAATVAAGDALSATFRAGEGLTSAYISQVIRKRLEHSQRLPTLLGCGLNADPGGTAWAEPLAGAINSARVRCSWAELAPTEGRYRWDSLDAQIDWCRTHQLLPMAGPILDFNAAMLPDWLWLWAGDVEAVGGMALDLVREAVTRYKGTLGNWHIAARPASAEVLGLGMDDQIRLAARCVQVAHQIDPATPLVVDFDRPWAEWLGSSRFQVGPLHVADSLSRAEIGLSGVGIEVAPGYSAPGSHLRDLFEFSRLLDLYSLLNQPLYVTIALPSGVAEDPYAATGVRVEARQWPHRPSPALQRERAARWISLAVAKPFVRAVTIAHATDSAPHLYPHAGLFNASDAPKPLHRWLREFREHYIA